MISKGLLVIGGLAVTISVTAFPSFQDSGLQSLVSWSLESDTADRVRRDADDDCDARCQRNREKQAAREAKKAAKEAAVAAKKAAKAAANLAKEQARQEKVQAKEILKQQKSAAKAAAVQAKKELKEARVAAKEAIREARKTAKAVAVLAKANAKANSRLYWKKLETTDVCVVNQVAFAPDVEEEFSVTGQFVVTKPNDAPNNDGWYVLADPPKRHYVTSVVSEGFSTTKTPAAVINGFGSWCDQEMGSGWSAEDAKTFVADLVIDFTGSTSAAEWNFYYCYSPVGEGDDEELTC